MTRSALEQVIQDAEYVRRSMNAPMSEDDDAESLALALYDPVDRLASAVRDIAAILLAMEAPDA